LSSVAQGTGPAMAQDEDKKAYEVGHPKGVQVEDADDEE
jgi:hypothetical protein